MYITYTHTYVRNLHLLAATTPMKTTRKERKEIHPNNPNNPNNARTHLVERRRVEDERRGGGWGNICKKWREEYAPGKVYATSINDGRGPGIFPLFPKWEAYLLWRYWRSLEYWDIRDWFGIRSKAKQKKAEQNKTEHSTAQHSTAQHSTAQQNKAN